CRTVNGIGMAVLCMIILLHYRSRALFFIIPASFLTILLLSYNVYFFDSWKGGDSVLHELPWELDRVEGDSWSTPLWIGFPGQLISPSRGIFIFSPFLVFSVWGMFSIWKKNIPVWRILAYTIPIPIIMFIV